MRRRASIFAKDWCGWTGNSWDKTRAVIGNSFRLCGPEHSIYTMAASAVLKLILDYDVDPRRVGFRQRLAAPLLNASMGAASRRPFRLQTKRPLDPLQDWLLVEKSDRGGFDRVGIVVAGHNRGDDGIALVIEGDRKAALAAARRPGEFIGAAAALHPANFDLAAWAQRREFVAQQVVVADAIEFFIVGHAGRAIAKADLGANEDGIEPLFAVSSGKCTL